MRRRGLVVTAFYAALVVTLLWPVSFRLGGESWEEAYRETFGPGSADLLVWLPVGLLVAGQGLLLFITVDTSSRRVSPRQRVWVSASVMGLFVGLLAFALVSSIWATISEPGLERPLAPWHGALSWTVWLFGMWALWGGVSYSYYRSSPARIAGAVPLLLRGSVLELLVAVPAHVIVRRRDDCSAPFVTGFGIATGVAVMLACFGPGVLALYKKRLDGYRR